MAGTYATLLACISLTVVDGDTIKCDGQNMRLIGDGAPYVSGIDTPETGGRAKCQRERLLGKQATLRLRELINQPGTVIEDSGAVDRWKRPLVRVRLRDGRTAGAVLLSEGYAARWRPGYEPRWCEE